MFLLTLQRHVYFTLLVQIVGGTNYVTYSYYDMGVGDYTIFRHLL